MALITVQDFKKQQMARPKRSYIPEWEVNKFVSDAYDKLAPEREKVTGLLLKAKKMLMDSTAMPFSEARAQMRRDSYGLVDEAKYNESRLVLPFAYGREVVPGNLLLNEGIAELQLLVTGTGTPTAWSNAAAYLGVGDSATAAVATQTDLQATTNKLYKAMESGYPSISSQTTTWRSVFGSAEANFAWNEFTVSNTSAGTGDNLNRKVSAEGTKSSGQTWTLDLSILWS